MERELLAEALEALDFYANKDNHKMRREPSYRDRFSQNMKPGRPKLGRVSEDKGKRARAAADKIRAALEHDSAHIVYQMRDIATNTYGMCTMVAEKMNEHWNVTHTPNSDFDPERSQ